MTYDARCVQDAAARLGEMEARASSLEVREPTPRFYMKRELNQNLSGNEVYDTAFSLLVILKNSCSKLHRQKSFDLLLLSSKIRGL